MTNRVRKRLVLSGLALLFLATGVGLWAYPLHRSTPSLRIPMLHDSVACGAPLAALRKTPNDAFINLSGGIIYLTEPTGIAPRCVHPARVRVAEGGVLIVVSILLLWLANRTVGGAGDAAADPAGDDDVGRRVTEQPRA